MKVGDFYTLLPMSLAFLLPEEIVLEINIRLEHDDIRSRIIHPALLVRMLGFF